MSDTGRLPLPRFRVSPIHRFRQLGLPVPTGDGVAVAVLAALLLFVAINLQAGWVYAIDAVLLGLLLAGWGSTWLSTRGIAVTRGVPREVGEGERLHATVHLQTRRWTRHFVELREPSSALHADVQTIPALAPGRPIQIACPATARHRGVYHLDGVEVRSGGLTGLFASRVRLAAPAELTVFPRYWVLADLPVPARAPDEHAVVFRVRRDGIEVVGVRDFRDGDSLRHVHWRSTARRGAVVVKEFTWEVSESPVLLLDTRPAGHAAAPGGASFEDLVRAAASVAQFITRGGRSVQIVTGRRTSTDRILAGWRQALHVLAGLSADGAVSPVELYATLPPGTPAVVISPDADAVAALAQHGAPIVAVLIDAASYQQSSQSTQSAQSTQPAQHSRSPFHRTDSANPEDSVGRADRVDRADSGHAGLMLLEALGVPVAVVRRGEEVGACLHAWTR